MRAAVLAAMLAAPVAAAQTPALAVSAGSGIARYADAAGADTAATHAPMLFVHVAAGLGPATLRVAYAEAALGDGRQAVSGAAGLAVAVYRGAWIGVGLMGLADVPPTGAPRRWWAVEMQGGAVVPLPLTPLSADLTLGVGPAGGLNRAAAFRNTARFEAGLRLALPDLPVTLRLAYALRRAGAEGLRDAFETVTLGASWTWQP